MTSAVFTKSGNGRYDVGVRSADDEWQIALTILYGPFVLALSSVPRNRRYAAVLMLARKANEMIE